MFTSRFTDGDPIVATILQPFQRDGVSQAQFFANAVDTETLGVDIVAEYATPLGRGQLTLTGAANFTDTDVKRINVPPDMSVIFAGGDPSSTLFNREEFNRLETALPRQKVVLSANYGVDQFRVIGRANYFGEVLYRPTNEANDENFGAKALIDLDVSYEISNGVRLTVGANNIFNTLPDQHELDSNLSSGRFPYSRRVTQFGMNGGFYYGRLQLTL